jgi:hypothetical protein
MNQKFFVRLMGLTACVVTFAMSNEAEAGRWHRRHACNPCCEPVCCEPVCCEPVCCEPVCCEPVCVTSCAPSSCAPACETVAWYDSCGRLVYRRAACCETIVSSRIVVPAATCCGIASTGSADTAVVVKTDNAKSVVATTASVVK